MDVRDELKALSAPTNDLQDLYTKCVMLIDILREKVDTAESKLDTAIKERDAALQLAASYRMQYNSVLQTTVDNFMAPKPRGEIVNPHVLDDVPHVHDYKPGLPGIVNKLVCSCGDWKIV